METAQLIDLPAPEPILKTVPVRPFLNREAARLAGIKSGEQRRLNRLNPKPKPPEPSPAPVLEQTIPVPGPVPHEVKLNVLEDQIKRVDQLIATAQNAKDFLALSQAKDRLLRNFCYLANIAGPGTRKPKPEQSTRSTQPCTPSDESNGV